MEPEEQGKMKSDVEYIKKGVDKLVETVGELKTANSQEHAKITNQAADHNARITVNENNIKSLFTRYNAATGGLIVLILTALGYLLSRVI